jgi:hypothetical protein
VCGTAVGNGVDVGCMVACAHPTMIFTTAKEAKEISFFSFVFLHVLFY